MTSGIKLVARYQKAKQLLSDLEFELNQMVKEIIDFNPDEVLEHHEDELLSQTEIDDIMFALTQDNNNDDFITKHFFDYTKGETV